MTMSRFTPGAKALVAATWIELIDGEAYAKLLSRFLGTEVDTPTNELALSQAWDQNLTTQWHMRYGGPGIMIY